MGDLSFTVHPVFLARLLIVHGVDAGEVLRRLADELDRFQRKREK